MRPAAKTELLLDGNRGIYLPESFAHHTDCDRWHYSKEDRDILLCGPDHEHYWDAWSDVLDNAYFEADGHFWALDQDCDLFAIRDDHDWED